MFEIFANYSEERLYDREKHFHDTEIKLEYAEGNFHDMEAYL